MASLVKNFLMQNAICKVRIVKTVFIIKVVLVDGQHTYSNLKSVLCIVLQAPIRPFAPSASLVTTSTSPRIALSFALSLSFFLVPSALSWLILGTGGFPDCQEVKTPMRCSFSHHQSFPSASYLQDQVVRFHSSNMSPPARQHDTEWRN